MVVLVEFDSVLVDFDLVLVDFDSVLVDFDSNICPVLLNEVNRAAAGY